MSEPHQPYYKPVRRHDSGLYGVVWEGEQTRLSRKVALKVIKVEMSHMASAVDHARALARLNHPNIVTVYDVVTVDVPGEGSHEAACMEWLEGETVGEILKRGGIEQNTIVRITRAVIEGLKYMHAKETFHSDLHPGNVLVGENFVKIIDIDAISSNSLARQSTMTIEARRMQDISYVVGMLRNMVNRCRMDLSYHQNILNELGSVQSLDAILDVVGVIDGEVQQSNLNMGSKTDEGLKELQDLDLSEQDIHVLRIMGEMEVVGRYVGEVISLPKVGEIYESQVLPKADLSESVEILEAKGFFREEVHRFARYVRLSPFGFERYLRAFDPSYQIAINVVAAAIVNESSLDDVTVAANLNLPRPLVMHIFDALAANDYCTLSRSNVGYRIVEVKASLRRKVRKASDVEDPLPD
jgi:DNA-binding MarR family transcriptional regulator